MHEFICIYIWVFINVYGNLVIDFANSNTVHSRSRQRGEEIGVWGLPQIFQFSLSANLLYFDSATLEPRIRGGS